MPSSTETDTAPSLRITPESWTQTLSLEKYLDTARPLEVDVGCGKGRFLTARAHRFPEHNFIGIERQLVRIRRVEKKIRHLSLTNVRLLRIEALYGISYLLPDSSVSTFYVSFPDPWPKRRHHDRRLFSEMFLDTLVAKLAPAGCIHVATDHADYYGQITRLFENHERFDAIEAFRPQEDERTEFESLFLQKGQEIRRCSYKLTS